MTEAQKLKFYFPAWNGCTQANRWRSKLDLLSLQTNDGAVRSDLARMVITLARQIALARPPGQRELTGNDLRHACHIVALGKDKSSETLTNKELDRVVSLFRVLTDPENLTWLMAWENPEQAEMRRVEWFLRNAAPEAYVVEICERQFDTRNWESLDDQKKRWVATTIGKNWRHKKIHGARYTPKRALENQGTPIGQPVAPAGHHAKPVTNGGVYQLKPQMMFQPKKNPF